MKSMAEVQIKKAWAMLGNTASNNSSFLLHIKTEREVEDMF